MKKAKKYFVAMMLIILAPTLVRGANPVHFNVQYTSTGNTSTIMITSFTIGGQPAANGDEIGVFTPSGLLAGAGVYEGSNLAITANGDNDQTSSVIEGFRSGERYKFKAWRMSAGIQYDSVTVTYESGNSDAYSANSFVVTSSFNAVNRLPVLAFTDTTVTSQVGAAINFQARATDADNDSISYSFTGALPSAVTTTVTGLISGTPTDTGSFPLRVIASDRKGGLDTGTVRLSIRSLNRPPALAFSDTTISIQAGSAINFQVRSTDADNDSVSYNFTGTPPQGVTSTITGLISGMPIVGGFFSLQVIASDQRGGLDTGTVRLRINRSPALAFTDTTISGRVGTALSFQVRATDADTDSVSYSFTGILPQGVTFTVTGLISGVPTIGGFFTLQAIASDRNGGLDTGTVRLSLPLHFVPQYVGTGNNSSLVIQGFTIDGQPAENGDEIGLYTPSGLLAGAGTFTGSTVAITANGDNEQTPTIIEGFRAGEQYRFKLWRKSSGFEYDQVIITYASGSLETYSANAMVIITAMAFITNRPPVLAFTDTTVSGQVGTALNFQVRTTDADSDSVSLSFTGTLPPGVTTTSAGLISGTPADTGSFPLQVIASDRKGGLDSGTVRLSIRAIPSLIVSLSSGWNLISSNVTPNNPRIDSIFRNIVSSVGILKNILGRVYWPRFGINQIGNWVSTEGYWVYMTSAGTINFTGSRMNATTPIVMTAGWKIIAYLPTTPLSPATALATLGSKVVIMKDALGKVYWPRFNVDQIGTMQVGKGYLIYLNSDGTLTYPAGTSKEGNNSIVENRNREQMNPQHFSYIRGTGANATILIKMNEKPVINGIAVEIGDEIGVFTPERICAGAGVWNGDNVVMAVWGDDGETTTIDGFTDGQAYTFKLWDKSAKTEKDISVTAESGTLSYTENGITIISYENSAILPDNFALRQNYPNPFNPTTHIEYQIKEQSDVTLVIYNIAGQLMRKLVQSSQPAGVYSVEWDGRNSSGIQVPSGIYLYRLKAGSFVETRKMVMMK